MFLLGIIGVMMLHNAVPHVHHLHEGHETISGSLEYHHHSHEHGHHHPDENKSNEQDGDFLFSFLLKIHSHTYHTQEFAHLTTGNFRFSKVMALSIAGAQEMRRFILYPENQKLGRYALFKEEIYNNPFFFTHSLRGPPALG